MDTSDNYDDVIINRPRSQGVTGEIHRTTCFYPFHVYMSIRHVFCVMKSFKGKGILKMSYSVL